MTILPHEATQHLDEAAEIEQLIADHLEAARANDYARTVILQLLAEHSQECYAAGYAAHLAPGRPGGQR